MGNQANFAFEQNNHVPIIYLPLMGTNLLLNTSAKLWENLRMPTKIVHVGSYPARFSRVKI
jgi:hypothetical protein